MQFLADANVSNELVDAVRALGHDCTEPAFIPPKASDEVVLQTSVADQRVLITSDKDFGYLVFFLGQRCLGVVQIRLDVADETDRVRRLLEAWPEIICNLPGSFITVGETSVRVRELPRS